MVRLLPLSPMLIFLLQITLIIAILFGFYRWVDHKARKDERKRMFRL